VRRSGGLLIEVLVALAVAGGPLLIALGVIQSSITGARYNAERATARIALMDVTELLLGASIEGLRALAKSDTSGWLDTFLEERIAHLPDAARAQYEATVSPYMGRFSYTFEEKLDPGAEGLARLTLSVKIGDQSTVTVVRLFRPLEREAPE
jgi:type II secretory pathway pseudopilin PulG